MPPDFGTIAYPITPDEALQGYHCRNSKAQRNSKQERGNVVYIGSPLLLFSVTLFRSLGLPLCDPVRDIFAYATRVFGRTPVIQQIYGSPRLYCSRICRLRGLRRRGI